LEIDVESLARVAERVRGWRDAHSEGLGFLERLPEVFSAATVVSGEAHRTTRTTDSDADAPPGGKKKQTEERLETAVQRAMRAAPSPRLREFLARGNRHFSEVTAAPQALADAIDGVARCAAACADNLREATLAFGAFLESSGGVARGSCEASAIDAAPTAALLCVVPFGKDPKTVEQWIWACAFVLDGLVLETSVAREIAAYVAPGTRDGSRPELDDEPESLAPEKLSGCAEVWRARPFVDETLLDFVADAREE
jgi:hypothetical protein